MDHSSSTEHSIIVQFLRGALITAMLLAGLAQVASAAEPSSGEVKVLAQVPQPGFPEGVVRRGLLTFVTGPATFALAGKGIHSVKDLGL